MKSALHKVVTDGIVQLNSFPATMLPASSELPSCHPQLRHPSYIPPHSRQVSSPACPWLLWRAWPVSAGGTRPAFASGTYRSHPEKETPRASTQNKPAPVCQVPHLSRLPHLCPPPGAGPHQSSPQGWLLILGSVCAPWGRQSGMAPQLGPACCSALLAPTFASQPLLSPPLPCALDAAKLAPLPLLSQQCR